MQDMIDEWHGEPTITRMQQPREVVVFEYIGNSTRDFGELGFLIEEVLQDPFAY